MQMHRLPIKEKYRMNESRKKVTTTTAAAATAAAKDRRELK